MPSQIDIIMNSKSDNVPPCGTPESKEIPPVRKRSPTSNLQHEIPPVPKRPLTSFNLFSMLERRVLIILQQEQETQEGDSTANSNSKASTDSTLNASNIYSDPYGAVRPQRYRNLVMPPNWYVVGANRIRRQDHKNHGLISFTDLSVKLSKLWKEADDETKEFCKKIAAGEYARYRKEQEEYKKKYGVRLFLAQRRTYKKRRDKMADDEAVETVDDQTKQPQKSATAPGQHPTMAPAPGQHPTMNQYHQYQALIGYMNQHQQTFPYILNPTNATTGIQYPGPGRTSFNMPIPHGHGLFTPQQQGVNTNSFPSSGGQMIHNDQMGKQFIPHGYCPFIPQQQGVNTNSFPPVGRQIKPNDNSIQCSKPGFESRLVSNEMLSPIRQKKCSTSCASGCKSAVCFSPEDNNINPSEKKLAPETKVGQSLSNSMPKTIHQNRSVIGNTTEESSNDVTNKDRSTRWIKYLDQDSKKHYYFNTDTRITQWDEPQSKDGVVVIYEYEHDTGELKLEI